MANHMTDHDLAYWLADKIPAYGDYAKQSADVLKKQADEIETLREALRHHGEEAAKLIEAKDELLAAVKAARDWLAGWASADPYLSALNAAIAKHTKEPE